VQSQLIRLLLVVYQQLLLGLFGLPYHHSNASTGTWLGFNRATTPEIRANRVNAAGGLALPFARLAINKIGDRIGMDTQIQVEAWMHPAQKQAYEAVRTVSYSYSETAQR
jgi:hypothetical protein